MKPFDIKQVPKAEGVEVVLRDGRRATAFVCPKGRLYVSPDDDYKWSLMDDDGRRMGSRDSPGDIVGFYEPPVVGWAVVHKNAFFIGVYTTKEAAEEIAGLDPRRRVVKMIEVPDTDKD